MIYLRCNQPFRDLSVKGFLRPEGFIEIQGVYSGYKRIYHLLSFKIEVCSSTDDSRVWCAFGMPVLHYSLLRFIILLFHEKGISDMSFWGDRTTPAEKS